MDIMERLLDVAADRSGDGPSGPAYDPELLTVMSEAADEISRLRGTHAADDERLATAAQRVGIVAGCDAAKWMADEITRLRTDIAHWQSETQAWVKTCNRATESRGELHAENERLRDENESLRGSLEEWKLDLNRLRDENAKLSALLLWALYHHQGGSSEVGQPIRRALGIGQYDPLTPSQIEMAKSAAMPAEPAPEEPRVMARFDDGRPMMTYRRVAMQKGE